MELRPAHIEDAPAISALIRSLSRHALVSPDGAGAEAFFASTSQGAEAAYIADPRYRFIVAWSGTEIAGFVAIRDNGHVFHLFVAPQFQRRGLARQLWQAARSIAIASGNTDGFTVNSTVLAVPVYERFGFVRTGAVCEQHGICFVPMRFSPDHARAQLASEPPQQASPSMTRTLIAYSTVDGHTLKICARLKQLLVQIGHSVELVEIGSADDVDTASFDIVVVGASIRYGKHRPEVYRFIDANREALEQKPSAFFSVNIVARKAGKNTPASNPYVKAFRRRTTWEPKEIGVFAGKLDYPRYGFADRQVIRLIMWLTKGPTDPKACIEFTDWQAVEKFAQRVADMSSAGRRRI